MSTAWKTTLWLLVALAATACSGNNRNDSGIDTPDGGIVDGSTESAANDTSSTGAFGAACTRDADCSSGLCLSIGRCSRPCGAGTDCPTSPNWMCVSLPGRGTVCDCTPRAMTDLPCNNVDDDCNGAVDDTSRTCAGVCIDVASDSMNCGNCGIACGGGTTCQAGRCECTSAAPTVCGTRCVNTMTDAMNCGACGMVCPGGGTGMTSCVMGRCGLTCPAGSGDCDGNPANGCETDTRSSLAHCGMCGRACNFANAMGTCSTGSCVIGACNTGFDNCDGDPSNGCETDTRTSVPHCGACGRACVPANGVGTCASGMCELAMCNAGFANCNFAAADGCEVDTRSDLRNCGACGRVCPGAGAPNTLATCMSAMCGATCVSGFGDCDGNATNGCETNTASTVEHCGMCGRACPSGQVCASGACTVSCTFPLTNCGGSCVDVSTSDTHCGMCGRACGAGSTCSAGTCRRLIGGLGGMAGFGTDVLPVFDDGSSMGAIDLATAFPTGLNYYGMTYNNVWVNNNGNVSFGGAFPTYTVMPFPTMGTIRIIAPWLADVDTRGSLRPSGVYWNVRTGQFVATWFNVGYYSGHQTLQNSFQLVLRARADVAPGDFDVEFRYERCEWTTGDASGGMAGLGGMPAVAGFNRGDGMDGLRMPGSGTMAMLMLCTTSNVSQPGIWRWAVRGGRPM